MLGSHSRQNYLFGGLGAYFYRACSSKMIFKLMDYGWTTGAHFNSFSCLCFKLEIGVNFIYSGHTQWLFLSDATRYFWFSNLFKCYFLFIKNVSVNDGASILLSFLFFYWIEIRIRLDGVGWDVPGVWVVINLFTFLLGWIRLDGRSWTLSRLLEGARPRDLILINTFHIIYYIAST